MIAPRWYTGFVYLALLLVVLAAIVVLSRAGAIQEATTSTDSAQGPPRRFAFTPYTVKPRCLERCEPRDVLDHLPAGARELGVACEVTIGLHVDTEGRVIDTDILRTGGRVCDEAVERWARTTRWSSAYNRDRPVSVWIAHVVRVDATLETA